jgi:excisionase family DNA binding protein
MDKKTVANYLGVSEKSVSRYAASGKLASRYIQGKNGRQLDFEEADVEKFKEELALPVMRAFVKPAQDNGGQDTIDNSAALATLPDQNAALLALLGQLQGAGQAGQPRTGQGQSVVPIADKMLLSLDEARALTGLSRGVIVAAIKAGELPALTIGRGYKLRPDDLEDWIEKMFKISGKGKK